MIGATVGNYRVISQIGIGGMGEVFLAEHTAIGTRVAIKVLLAGISRDPEQVDRFFNEARAVNKVKHVGPVKIFDVGYHVDPNGHKQAYLVMEFLDGESLAGRIKRLGCLPGVQVADIGRQIAGVLEAVHSAGIIHRDLKPDNIFLIPDQELASGERVKVLDFGIAKLTGTMSAGRPQTKGTMGTPAYMAPEQWNNAAAVDGSADTYSLGCVMFEMAVGKPPFPSQTIGEACNHHLNSRPPRASELQRGVPPQFDSLIDRMLAKHTYERPTIKEVARAIDEIRQTGVAATMVPSQHYPAPPPPQSQPFIPPPQQQLPSQPYLPAPPQPTMPVHHGYAPPAPPKKKSKALLFVIIGVVVAGGAVAAVLVLRDRTTPLEAEIKACDARSGAACAALAKRHDTGDGVPKDEAKATDYYFRACQSGDQPSCPIAGLRLIETDRTRATEALDRACRVEGTDGTACYALGRLVGYPKDMAKRNANAASTAFRRGCERGNQPSCAELGSHLEDGRGIEPNIPKALELYRAACDKDVAFACHRAGSLTSAGLGTAMNTAESVQLYKKACQLKDPRGCLDAGWAYVHGFGIPVEVERGERLGQRALELAKEQCDAPSPDARACGTRGLSHYHAIGVPRDLELTVKFVKKGCELGDSEACSNYGNCLVQAIGTTKDVPEGNKHNQLACDAGYDGACSSIAQSMLDDGELDKAKDLAERALRGGGDYGYEILASLRNEVGKRKKEDRDVINAAMLPLYQKGCDAGNSDACYGLASLANTPWQHKPADPVLAQKLAAKSCALSSRDGCVYAASFLPKTEAAVAQQVEERMCTRSFGLSGCLELGLRLKDTDAVRSADAYHAACKAAPTYCVHVGIGYYNGKPMKKDLELALEAFEKACNAKNGNACDWMALLLDTNGGGVIPVDKPRAKELRVKACQYGVVKACKS